MVGVPSLLLYVMPLTATPVEADDNWSMLSLILFGAVALFLGLLFARKTAQQYIAWVKAQRPRDNFTSRVMGLFYDWGASRLKSDESSGRPANVFVLMIIETLIAAVLFSLPFILHKWIALFIIAVIVLGCALFTGMTSRINPDDEKMAAAFIMPLQIYAALTLCISLIIFIIIEIYEFFRRAITHTSDDSKGKQQTQQDDNKMDSMEVDKTEEV